MMRSRKLKLALLALVASVALAGCAGGDGGGPQEGTSTDEMDPTPLSEPGTGGSAACAPEGSARPGYGTSGSTQPGEVGTGTGDIGSDTACPAPEQGAGA